MLHLPIKAEGIWGGGEDQGIQTTSEVTTAGIITPDPESSLSITGTLSVSAKPEQCKSRKRTQTFQAGMARAGRRLGE